MNFPALRLLLIGPKALNERFVVTYCGKKQKVTQPTLIKDTAVQYFCFNLEAKKQSYRIFQDSTSGPTISGLQRLGLSRNDHNPGVLIRLQLWDIAFEDEFHKQPDILSSVEFHGCICTSSLTNFTDHSPILCRTLDQLENITKIPVSLVLFSDYFSFCSSLPRDIPSIFSKVEQIHRFKQYKAKQIVFAVLEKIMDRELELLNESPDKCTVEWATLSEFRKLDEFLGSIPDSPCNDSRSIISGPSVSSSIKDGELHESFRRYDQNRTPQELSKLEKMVDTTIQEVIPKFQDITNSPQSYRENIISICSKTKTDLQNIREQVFLGLTEERHRKLLQQLKALNTSFMQHRVLWMQKLLFYQQTGLRRKHSNTKETSTVILSSDDKFTFHNVGSVPTMYKSKSNTPPALHPLRSLKRRESL